MKLLVHASGYVEAPWKTDAAEIRTSLDPQCGGTSGIKWSPSSKDFAVVGSNSGGSSPAKSIDELLNLISQQGVESIEELRILGHANNTVLSLAGKIVKDNVDFAPEAAFIGPSDTFTKAIPKFRDLQDRFSAGAKVILMGCNSGSGSDALLSLLSTTFLRAAAGFKEEIQYSFDWGPTGPAKKDRSGKVICTQMTPHSKVTKRGKIIYDPALVSLERAIGNTSLSGHWTTNAWQLDPDAKSDAGDIFAVVRRKDPATAAHEFAWRVMTLFFEKHAWVSGTSIDPSSPGLRVRRPAKDKFLIDVNPDYARKTTPRTLKLRVAEMGQALELVSRKVEGTVSMK